MNPRFAIAFWLSLLALAVASAAPPPLSGTSPSVSAPFTAEGRLKPPVDYRKWTFLTSSLDMSYRKDSSPAHSMFDNVFVEPQAYRSFVQTGTWPEGTELVKESRSASAKGSINRGGKFQSGDAMGFEVHVKDSKRFADGWGFFYFDSVRSGPAQMIPAAAPCYSCHRQHGAVDSTFVQFYPTLIGIALRKRTLSSGYRP